MDSFKIRKKMLLKWFLGGNYIDLCSQPGPSFGDILSTTPLPIDNHKEVLNRLIRDGAISFKTTIHFGMRWERLLPTKGIENEHY